MLQKGCWKRQGFDSSLMLTLSVLVGLAGGCFSIFFIYMIGVCKDIYFVHGSEILSFLGDYYVILVPALGGLLVGPIIYFGAREAKGHGVPEVMLAVALNGGKIRPRVSVVKAIASAITIGSGGSVGREGPIIQIGAAVGSTFGQWLKLSEHRTKTLVACGAAAGISAVFNAPIAGTLFALEVILGEMEVITFGYIVVSSVLASVVARAFLGTAPAFNVPIYELVSPFELVFYGLLGFLSAVMGTIFVKVLYGTEDIADRFTKVPQWLMPVFGGVLMGVLGFMHPEIFGTGAEAMETAMSGQMALKTLLLLTVFKIVATSITIASGGSGGVFAPALFIGAMFGGGFGTIVHQLFPTLTASAGAYALVGMAAVFASSSRAPITAILIIFEMTGDYTIILPLMITTVISVHISSWLLNENIYTMKLVRRGINIRQGKAMNVMDNIKVSEAMSTNVDHIDLDNTLGDVIKRMQINRHSGYPVADKNMIIKGMITLHDVRNVKLEERLTKPVDEVMSKDVAYTLPDQSLSCALHLLTTKDVGRLPVVSDDETKELIGIITRSDIIKAYDRALLEINNEQLTMGQSIS